MLQNKTLDKRNVFLNILHTISSVEISTSRLVNSTTLPFSSISFTIKSEYLQNKQKTKTKVEICFSPFKSNNVTYLKEEQF
jgi:hypothetical protein